MFALETLIDATNNNCEIVAQRKKDHLALQCVYEIKTPYDKKIASIESFIKDLYKSSFIC